MEIPMPSINVISFVVIHVDEKRIPDALKGQNCQNSWVQ